jgi:uncharacterized surface protein with fasciclin (FAS1) repeats
MRLSHVLLLGLALTATVASAQQPEVISAPAPDAGPQWADVIDLLDSKNDTTLIWNLIQAAGLVDTIDSLTNMTATVFLPRDEELAQMASMINTSDEALIRNILSYHVIPGQALTLEELTDGLQLQSALAGAEGMLQVNKPANTKKPRLDTTSGQVVPIYQYNIRAGDAIVHTIKGVLIPGTQGLPAPGAAAPAPM